MAKMMMDAAIVMGVVAKAICQLSVYIYLSPQPSGEQLQSPFI